MSELPADVLLRLGPAPQDLTRLGSSRVMRGSGLVAKSGPPERIAREAFLFGEAAALMPVGLPKLVDAGPGWIVTEDAAGQPVLPDDVAPLEGLAWTHELFEGAAGVEHERFRDVFGREREGLLSEARVSANAAALTEPLASLLADPSPLIAIVEAQPRTLVHGDAWPGNVVSTGPRTSSGSTGPSAVRGRPRSTWPSGCTAPRGLPARPTPMARSSPTSRLAPPRLIRPDSGVPWTRSPSSGSCSCILRASRTESPS